MKKQLFTLLGIAVIFSSSLAQTEKPKKMPCGTFEAMEEAFKADPELKLRYEASQAQFEIAYQQALNANNTVLKTAATVYTIPVVFHIMGPQNITDQVFIDFMKNVNDDYAKLGNDTASVSPLYKSIHKDVEIRFALAKKDPLGNCTNGIIRHNTNSTYWSQTSPNYLYSGTGTNRWPTNKYLNVYIVDCISSTTYSCPTTSGTYLGGYTYLPGGTPYTANGNMGDAIVYLKSLLGQSDPKDSRTLSHEMGHWLNLSHTFGTTNNPGAYPCGDPALNDFVGDTPETLGDFGGCPSSAGTNACDVSTNKNVENIMNYADCAKMFTQGQVTRMRTAIASATGGRNNLWTPANYAATGISGTYTCFPVADFKANKVNNCLAGNTFTFTSTSQVGASGSVSWNFQGGTPATSTSTSQVVSYASAGTYSVSLTAINTASTNTMNKISFINVVNGTGGLLVPSLSDFDGGTLPSTITVTNGNAGSVTWIQNTVSGGNTTPKSIFINNASVTSTGGHIDVFETPIYDFAGTSSVTISYYYAYAKRLATQADSFRIQYSLDCGGTWINVLGVPTTAIMAAASGATTTTAFVPTSSQWVAKTITASLLSALNNKPSVKFRFYFKSDAIVGRSNNIYIDQININGNVAVVTGITELEKSMELSIYPNPTSSSATLDFNISEKEHAKISVIDLMGRVLEENIRTADTKGHVNYMINSNGSLASGVYIVNIDVNNQRVSKKIIIE
ncbi:MAG: T9SS type A sorting domain-containing protein [Burkholderiales bacterium]|nr:T9SS type A sorting domain-containing protein [Bacteroidia bacterium]